MKKLEEELTLVLADVAQYNVKPNKALSKRVRKQLGELKKSVTGIRAELVLRDTNGYK